MLGTLIATICMGATGLVCLLWAVKKGQFENIEDAKYQMFRDDQ